MRQGAKMSDWKPIETAPKDRLIDIVFTLEDGTQERWCDCYYDWSHQWRTSRPGGLLVTVPAKKVTHWMERPDFPPVSGKERKKIKKFLITTRYKGWRQYLIEASDEEEAKSKFHSNESHHDFIYEEEECEATVDIDESAAP